MALTSLSGNRIQRLSMRAPMGVTVRSMTPSRLLPSRLMGSMRLEVAHGKLVESHISLLLDARQRGDVAYAGVVGEVEVMEYRARGYNGLLHRVHAKSLERACLKLLEQAVGGGVGGEYPVVELKGEVAAGECLLDPLLVAALHKHLLGSEIAQQACRCIHRALGQ